MSFQGVQLKKILLISGPLTFLLFIIYFSPANVGFLSEFVENPIVSFLGWFVSIVAGSIAIFEFLSYKAVKRQYEALKLKVENRDTRVSGNATYVESLDGSLEVNHGRRGNE